MIRPISVRAFSLLEVLIAVALFVSSVTAILALLPGLTRQSAESADRLAAQRLPEAVRVEVTRLAALDLDSLAAQIPVMNFPLSDGFALVATRNAARLCARDNQPPAVGVIAADDQYFLIECWQFPAGPLRYVNGQASLAVCVRVSWPYRGPAASPGTTSREFMFVTSLNR